MNLKRKLWKNIVWTFGRNFAFRNQTTRNRVSILSVFRIFALLVFPLVSQLRGEPSEKQNVRVARESSRPLSAPEGALAKKHSEWSKTQRRNIERPNRRQIRDRITYRIPNILASHRIPHVPPCFPPPWNKSGFWERVDRTLEHFNVNKFSTLVSPTSDHIFLL